MLGGIGGTLLLFTFSVNLKLLQTLLTKKQKEKVLKVDRLSWWGRGWTPYGRVGGHTMQVS